MRDFFTHIQQLFIICLMLCFSVVSLAQLSGTYTLGTGGDYTTFQQAADALMSEGVSGAVTFNVVSGSYNEQVNIETIAGSGVANTITFQSASGDSSDVVLTYAATTSGSNYVVRLGAGASYVFFKDLTIQATGVDYGRGVVLEDNVQHLSFLHCHFKVPYSTQNQTHFTALFSDGYYPDYITVERCYFDSVTIGIYLSHNNSGMAAGISILENVFQHTGYKAMHLHHPSGYVIRGNTVVGPYYGILMSVGHTTGSIVQNRLHCEQVGIQHGIDDDITTPVNISNNFIHIADGGGHCYGIIFNGQGRLDICNNTIVMMNDGGDDYALYLSSSTAEDKVNILNNILACTNLGAPLNINQLPLALIDLDYNCYYTTGISFGISQGKKLKNLAEIQAEFGMDAHSFVATPVFVSDTTVYPLTAWYSNKGKVLPHVTEDIDANLRSATNPDVGACEYTPLSYTQPPYAGSYTVGVGGDFPDVQHAMDSLHLKGIASDVTLDMLPGDYHTQVEVLPISGASYENEVILQSQEGDPYSVLLHNFQQEDNESGYVLKLNGTDHFSVQDLTLKGAKAPGVTAHNAGVFLLYGGSEGLTIEGNVLKSIYDSNNYAYESMIFGQGNFTDSMRIINNLLDSCSTAIYFQNNDPKYAERLLIEANEFRHIGYKAVHLQNMSAPKVRENEVDSDGLGMYMFHCNDEAIVTGNHIQARRDYGLYFNGDAADTTQSLLANNFVMLAGTSSGYGLFLSQSEHSDILHNSIHVTNTNNSSIGFKLYAGDSLVLLNNTVDNVGGGYSFYFYGTASIDSLDYNNYHCSGSALGKWETTVCNDLAAFQTVSNHEAHSMSVDPHFVSDTDLHLTGTSLVEVAAPVARVTTDIDGELRDMHTPDIGADEYSIMPNTAPYVNSPIADQIYVEDMDTLYIARLDTVFADDNPDDILTYRGTIDEASLGLFIHKDTVKLKAAADYFGQAQLIVTAMDPASLTASDTVIITIENVQDAPVALEDTVELLQAADTTIHVLGNDYDVDGDVLFVEYVSMPKHGTAVIQNGDLYVNYTPETDFWGADSLRYGIADGNGGRDTTTLYLNVIQQSTFVGKLSQDVCIFPNPVVSTCKVVFNEYQDYSRVEVLSVQGRVIAQKEVSGHTMVWDFSEYASGVYLLKIYGIKGTLIRLLIKE